MKKILVILFLTCFIYDSYSQNKYLIGFEGGVVMPDFTRSNNWKVGSGYSITFKYKLSQKIQPYISFGQLTVGNGNNFLNNVSLNQIALGGKYYFSLNNSISIVGLLEGQYNFGEIVIGYSEWLGTTFGKEKIYKKSYEEDISAFATAAGFGLEYNINDDYSIRINYVLGFWGEETKAYNSKLYFGFDYAL
jgi:hypothetical protein